MLSPSIDPAPDLIDEGQVHTGLGGPRPHGVPSARGKVVPGRSPPISKFRLSLVELPESSRLFKRVVDNRLVYDVGRAQLLFRLQLGYFDCLVPSLIDNLDGDGVVWHFPEGDRRRRSEHRHHLGIYRPA